MMKKFCLVLFSALVFGPPVWAEYNLSDQSVEQDMGFVEPSLQLQDFPDEKNIFHFNKDLWNQAQEAIRQGRTPGEETVKEEAEEELDPSLETPAPAAPEPGISVTLPYESGLSISGRKLISVKLKETNYKSEEYASQRGLPKKQRDFEMDQELQVRIKGKVGRKITVNVDFDDTKEDKRDISVVYEGDPEEVVQEAAFGDITLSLPATEFVSYSKQLFGVRTRLKYKDAQLMAIGSRTKGITETKRFTGNTKFERKEISDTAYYTRRYYDIVFTTHSIVPGTVEIWRNDNNPDNNANARLFDDVPEAFKPGAEDFAENASTVSGYFDKLVPVTDFSVDLVKGIVCLTSPARQDDVLIIDYTLANGLKLSDLGTPGRLTILKTEDDEKISFDTEVGYRRELKTFYSIGRTKIVHDNGQGNFIIHTNDLNGNTTSVYLTNGDPLEYLSDNLGNLKVDFEAGLFYIQPPLKVDDPELYDISKKTHKFSFLLEYQYKVRNYFVRPNLVFGSERVTVNGRLLTRDLDYFIDYDSGYLTFFNDDDIDAATQIEVTYEYAPFGGQLGQTLVGARTELSLVPGRFFLGSTMLYTFAPKPTIVPDIRSTPTSLMVLEADTRLTDIQVPFLPLSLSLSAEVAQSQENPNLFGKALVDSMEGIKAEDQTIMDIDFWQIASNPGGSISRHGSINFGEEEILLTDINPFSGADDGETQRVLAMSYDLRAGTAGEESSVIQSISRSGRDFSEKTYMELWVQGAGAAGDGVDLIVNAGRFNEDADGDTFLDTEDINDDNTLNTGEDVGWVFNDPGPDGSHLLAGDNITSRVGADNNRLDSEDLDQDGQLDPENPVRTQPLFRLSDVPTSSDIEMYDPGTGALDPEGDLNFTGWRFIKVPLNITAAEKEAFKIIQQVRVTFVGESAGSARAGTVRVGKISFVGNRWRTPVSLSGSTMTVSAVNNIDNPDYRSLIGNSAFNSLYEDSADNRTREQALSLKFVLPAGSSTTTRVIYPSARDFSKHKSLLFFLQAPSGKPTGETFFVQIGNDTDYHEYSIPITPGDSGAWRLQNIALTDLNDDGLPDVFKTNDPNASTRIVGKPNLANVGQIKLGVRNDTGASIDSELWVNEIHLSGSRRKTGTAQRFSADMSWPGWGAVGGKVREVDRNFQTLTAQIVNQDRKSKSAYFDFTRLRFLPLSGNVSKDETITPAAIRTGEAGLVSVLSEGKEENILARGQGQLLIPRLPAFGFSYEKSVIKSTERQEKKDRNTYTGTMDYAVPVKPDLLPGKKFSFRPLPESVSVKYLRINHFQSYSEDKKKQDMAVSTNTIENAVFSNAKTVEFTDDWSGRMTFLPWNGFNVTPNYSWKKVTEQKRFTDDDLSLVPAFENAKSYQKSLTQTQGLSASLRLFKWFEPHFNYALTGTETNALPTASSATAFHLKTIDRTGNGDISLTFRARDLFPNFKPTRSFSVDNSFRIESGDTYKNVAKEDNEWQKIRVFQFKKIERDNGGAIYGLLNQLEFTDTQARRERLTLRNTWRSSGNWSPLDWFRPPKKLKKRLRPLKTLNVTATVTHTEEHTEQADTMRDVSTVIWPDLIFSLRETERFFWLERWMKNSQLNIRANQRKTQAFEVSISDSKSFNTDYRFTLFRRYDVYLTYGSKKDQEIDLTTNLLKSRSEGDNCSAQVTMTLGPYRHTPSYTRKSDKAHDGAGKTTRDLTTETYAIATRLDKSYPSGFRIPFTKKVFGNVNRLIMDSKLTYERKKSSMNVERDNIDVYTANVTGEYEISRNFRLSFGGGFSMTVNREKKDNGFMSMNVNSQLVIQF